jgi:hypothetical protein
MLIGSLAYLSEGLDLKVFITTKIENALINLA